MFHVKCKLHRRRSCSRGSATPSRELLRKPHHRRLLVRASFANPKPSAAAQRRHRMRPESADPVLSHAFNHAECTFYAEHYAPSNPEIANRDWKTPFINQCEAREAIASGWIIDQWPTMSYEQYASCEVPYNRKLKEYGDTILAQIHMSYHGKYYVQELIRSCLETGSLMPEGYWTDEDRQMYLDSIWSKNTVDHPRPWTCFRPSSNFWRDR